MSPLTPSETRRLLDQLDHRARKNLGQNFLIDANIVRKSLQLADIKKDDTVVEVGPGLGTLTQALLNEGCSVYAVELDPTLSKHLQDNLCTVFPNTFKLLQGDAVAHPRAGMSEEIKSFKVVANLPYAITSPWIESMTLNPMPTDLVLMMQKEAAMRITANPGTKNFGAISIFVGAAFERAGVHSVSKSCFYPVPGVDSQLLHLKKKQDPYIFSKEGRKVIRKLFTQRRKQISSLLQKEPGLHAWLEELESHGATPKSRPEAIPQSAWVALDKLIQNSSS